MEKYVEIISCGTFWEALSAIGTLLAVIVSLYLANRKEKAYRRLDVSNTTTYQFDNGIIGLVVTLDNIGNRPIVIQECGSVVGNVINTTYNKYLTTDFKPQIIGVGEALILKYQKEIGKSFKEEDIENGTVKDIFSGKRFGVRDSRNIIHAKSAK